MMADEIWKRSLSRDWGQNLKGVPPGMLFVVAGGVAKGF